MAKQLVSQKYIFKIHSSRLHKAKWKLSLPLAEARRNDEVISLADSQVLRWLDELNGIVDAEQTARDIKAEIRAIRRADNSAHARRRIKQLYAELDNVQFKPDYLCVIMDKDKHYRRACKGFEINGLTYHRLLGTNGGVKNSTIVFIADRHGDEIRRRIDNGRNPEKELVPAKLEAYKALTCSASNPVSSPNGILVVDDCETEFLADIIYLDDEQDGEPVMEHRTEEKVGLDASDGFGLMMPSLAERWSKELHLDYTVSGLNTRCSWEKGMLFTFDFQDFADKVAGSYIVKDAWGNDVDVRNVEMVLTTSMLKLWDSYESCDDYIYKCDENHYTWGIPKVCPRELEHEHTTNYQFLQYLQLSDEDLDELIEPTVSEINDILHGDSIKTMLYLLGMGLNERNVPELPNNYAKALLIEPLFMEDSFVQSNVFNMIKNRINRAKVGVLNVHGNYSMASGDPYALCQNMFGLEVTGILKPGEIYNKYWIDINADKVACFRAPMSAPNSALVLSMCYSDDATYWYRYMKTCTIFNAWDCSCAALNGMDFDGDLVMLTDNRVIVDNVEPLPAVMCVQRKAKKRIVTEDDSIQANIDSFGDDIGKTTNWITSMYDVQSRYEQGSDEYSVLAYRIVSGQLLQQNAMWL